MKKVTIGGDRVGSGKKMTAELENYGRSTHDMGYIWRSTMSAGTIVPFLNELALPGDTFDIKLDCDVKTHPTLGPLFASHKIQLDIFEAPIRLYQGALHNNKLKIGLSMQSVLLPVINLKAPRFTLATHQDITNSQINPSCILAYLGIRGVGYVDESVDPGVDVNRNFNGVPFLAYWDIYKNYYANKQEEIGAVIHTPVSTPVTHVTSILATSTQFPAGTPIHQVGAGTDNFVLDATSKISINWATSAEPLEDVIFVTNRGDIPATSIALSVADPIANPIVITFDFGVWGNLVINNWRYRGANETQEPKVKTFPLSNIDDMREKILGAASNPAAFIVNAQTLTPYDWVCNNPATDKIAALQSQEGLAIKTYQSDLLNNWIKTAYIDAISAETSVDTSSGNFTVDQMIFAEKVYKLLNRVAITGGTYDDYVDTVWMQERSLRAETPMYCGGLSKELVFAQVISMAESTGNQGNQPLGTLAGRGTLGHKHKGGEIIVRVKEPSILIGLVSMTPRIDYSQGNKWHMYSVYTMNDLHKPQLDEIGFQDLITEQMAWWDTSCDGTGTLWIQKSAGKQPAYMNYMTNINQCYGNFAIENNEMFMTLNRRYEPAQDGTVIKITDVTTYIDPVKYNFIFAQTSIDAQNFWVQIAVDMEVRRVMSAKIMPNL